MAKIVAAMSGGVDSSVMAGLLLEQGHEVIGVHMKLHDAAPGGTAKSCCGLDDALDARMVADTLGIPFYVMNLREPFKRAVMDDLVENYVDGRTPNPCIQCNGVLKFKVLMARAFALGATHLATGHYAQISPDGLNLMEAVDPAKDQSYFLFPIGREALKRTLFPLGGMTKPEVRAIAERMGLKTAQKAESQDICFIADGDHGRFVREALPDLDGSGEIVDEKGKVLGHHDGFFQYTVGQRRGLGVALGYPAYVIRVEADTRRVVIGADSALYHSGLIAHRCNWFERPDPTQEVSVRIRHRGGLIPCTVGPGEPTEVRFKVPARAVAPGQAAVFYQEGRVLGGGWIISALETA